MNDPRPRSSYQKGIGSVGFKKLMPESNSKKKEEISRTCKQEVIQNPLQVLDYSPTEIAAMISGGVFWQINKMH